MFIKLHKQCTEMFPQNILAISGKNRTPKEFWSQRNEKFLHHDVLDPRTSSLIALGP